MSNIPPTDDRSAPEGSGAPSLLSLAVRIIRLHPFRMLIVGTCPIMAIVSLVAISIGGIIGLPTVSRFGNAALHAGVDLMLPIGCVCVFLSWRMARVNSEPASGAADLVEFLLGFAGFVMVILGAIISSIWWRLADYL